MPGPATARSLAALLRALPVKGVSRMAGRLAAARLPGPLLRPLIRGFGAAFGVDFDEARDPVASFSSFQDFFTRRLRDGARPVDPDPRAFVSPCDGAWGAAGRIEAGRLLQVKGRDYSLAALLGSADEATRLEGGVFATLYLSPRDYHRFHTPCEVEVVAACHLPGRLWPVNSIGLQGVDGLFAENERICAWMRPPGSDGPAPLCLVAVGATMVGSVRVEFDDLSTNVPGAVATFRRYQPPVTFARGAEWGRFEFGSTIVLVAAPGFLELEIAPAGAAVRLGTRIGTLC
jgi:phosphatidylserine decarboxylase